MSALIGRPPIAVTHEINPYIPDILRPTPFSTHNSRNINGCSSPTAQRLSLSSDPCADRLRHSHQLSQESSDCSTLSPPSCAHCHDVISDPYLFRICGQTWHESCAVCSTCSVALNDVCFLFEGRLYCRKDYDRLYATKCANCRQPMRSHELFMRASVPDSANGSSVLLYHVSCFTCAVCQQPLAAGDKYIIDPVSRHPICQADFLTAQHRPPPVADSVSSANRIDQEVHWTTEQSKPPLTQTGRRMRTSLTEEQRQYLQKSYEDNSRPPKHVREFLAKELSVPVRVVQVWFQNQRARDKRNAMQRRDNPRSVSTSKQRNHFSRSPSPSCAATPSPRTSVESGPLPDFSGYSCENSDPLVADLNESVSRPWLPAAAEAHWFTGQDASMDDFEVCD